MEPLVILAGLACCIYFTAEIASAASRRSASAGGAARFGVVDLDSGQEVEITIDRRGRSRDRRSLARA